MAKNGVAGHDDNVENNEVLNGVFKRASPARGLVGHITDEVIQIIRFHTKSIIHSPRHSHNSLHTSQQLPSSIPNAAMSPKEAARNSPEYTKHPFQLTSDDVAQQLQTNTDTGLSPAAVKDLQNKYGQNKLAGEGGVKWYAILSKQMTNAMILVGSSESKYARS